MKNRPFASNITATLLMNFFFVLKSSTAQQNEPDLNDSNAQVIMSVKIRDISYQIATMYGADVGTVESYVQAAVTYEDRIGIPASVVIGIAVYESSFKSYLFLNTGNPFGIKAGGDWTGPTFSKWDDGEETPFRVYNSPEEALLDFGAFVRARSWYADALACPRYDYVCVVDGLKKTDTEPGYSTNPEWDEKVVAMIEKLGLQTLSVRW